MNIKQRKECDIMKIQTVLIDSIKNLSNVKITFDNITALVSLNNFGKSNVLSGINFGLAYIKAGIEDKMELMSNVDLIPININMQYRNYRYAMEVLTEYEGVDYRVLYGYEFSWRSSKDVEPQII